MTEDIRTAKLVKRINRAFNSVERTNAETVWSLISEFVIPNQSGLFIAETTTGRTRPVGSSTPGAKKTERLFDSTAIQANQDLASAMHSTLTNPATKWSKIRFEEEELNNDQEAIEWLEDANDKLHMSLNETNFDTEAAKNYKFYTGLANMALMHEAVTPETDNFEADAKFTALHLSNIAWEENQHGRIDTVFRRFRLSARQAVEKWGDKLPSEVIKLAIEKPEDEVKFNHVIQPRAKDQIKLNEVGLAAPEFRPFESIFIEMKSGIIVEEGGFYEFPIHVTRWETLPGEVYGRGPGHIALPDVRTLNKVKQLGLHAIAKAIDPPLLATQRDIIGALDLRPQQVTVMRDINGIKALESNARFDVTNFAAEDLKNSINKIFLLDKLLLPPRNTTGEMTAFEIATRAEEMQRVIGPTLGRLNAEFLSPLVQRQFNILFRAGKFRDLPEILVERGVNVEIVFVNQLARSQQLQEISNIQAWVQEVAALAQVNPAVLDNIDTDNIAKIAAKIRGITEMAVTNDDEVKAIRDQRAQQQQQQQALADGQQAADIASKIPQE